MRVGDRTAIDHSAYREEPISASPVSYGYDASGQRVFQQSGGQSTWFVFDGLSVLMELGTDKKPTAVFVPGTSRTRLDLSEPLTEYYLHDGLGSVAQMADELGNPTQEYQYEPFGSLQDNATDRLNRYRFVGLASDDETGLTYMNARWYESGVGRFLSRDPVRCAIGNVQRLNLYSYADNNPISMIDRSGRSPQVIAAVGILAIIAADMAMNYVVDNWDNNPDPSDAEPARDPGQPDVDDGAPNLGCFPYCEMPKCCENEANAVNGKYDAGTVTRAFNCCMSRVAKSDRAPAPDWDPINQVPVPEERKQKGRKKGDDEPDSRPQDPDSGLPVPDKPVSPPPDLDPDNM